MNVESYEEIVYVSNKSNLTLLGEDRERVQIHYANSEIAARLSVT